jgi:hypothetical protein
VSAVQCDTCPYRIALGVERRPANALNLEIGTPIPRCTRKLPDHWFGAGRSALRWLGSGGSPLVFGYCNTDCPEETDPWEPKTMDEKRLEEIDLLYLEGTKGECMAVLPELIREVRRLNTLIKAAEWAGEHSHGDGSVCPWCRELERDGHKATCKAFGVRGIHTR